MTAHFVDFRTRGHRPPQLRRAGWSQHLYRAEIDAFGIWLADKIALGLHFVALMGFGPESRSCIEVGKTEGQRAEASFCRRLQLSGRRRRIVPRARGLGCVREGPSVIALDQTPDRNYERAVGHRLRAVFSHQHDFLDSLEWKLGGA